MNNYFESVVESLTIDDLRVLGVLSDNEAEVKFKAITKKMLNEMSKLSTANFRKSIYRLEIAKFINIVIGQKDHRVYITEFGQRALFTSLSEEVI